MEGVVRAGTAGHEDRELPHYRKARRATIIAAAAKEFLAGGIEDVKMTDVALTAGVGVATVYRYFGTKTNLAVCVGTLLWRQFSEVFGGIVERANKMETGLERMAVLLEQYSIVYHDHPELVSFLDALDHALLSDEADAVSLAEYDEVVSSFYAPYEAAFQKGVEDGSIRGDVDFPLYYRAISHALMGIAQKLMRGNVLPSDDFENADAEIDCMVKLCLAYLAC